MKIICISGKAQHGKDTAANILEELLTIHGNKVLIAHYGDLVKYISKTFFNWDGEKDERGRTLLQYIGTDVIRKQKPNYWVDFINQVISFFPNEWDYVLIPDCRFPNEYETLKHNNFDALLLRIDRPNYISQLTTEQQKHKSETALDDYVADSYIINDSDIKDLKLKVEKFIENKL